jgi:hypothetical protein
MYFPRFFRVYSDLSYRQTILQEHALNAVQQFRAVVLLGIDPLPLVESQYGDQAASDVEMVRAT